MQGMEEEYPSGVNENKKENSPNQGEENIHNAIRYLLRSF
jgi:hypothetical protein